MSQTQIQHVERLKQDARDEIKRRIEQRDKYSIQLTVVLSAIVAVSFSDPGLNQVLIAAPLAAIYFTVLILYSYRIHSLLSRYLRDEIEPLLAELTGLQRDIEWEGYYREHAIPGIRRSFFLAALWVVTVASLAFLALTESDDPTFRLVVVVVGALYLSACLFITLSLGAPSKS